jgi:leucine dehydrogenase
MEALLDGPKNVTEINSRLKIDQSLLSHHLKVLRDASLVTTRREGKSVRYAVAPDAIYGVEADIYAPSALGATINDETIPQLKVQIVAGAANNVLAEARHGDELHRRGILYAPDYVINAGGLINVYGELSSWTSERAMRKAGDIYSTLLRIFELSANEGVPTYVAADRIAEQRIGSIGKIHQTWV